MDRTRWSFEADYITACNCDWGCPCNFNAPPTRGNCEGWCAWRVKHGAFGGTALDDVKFAVFYRFPGRIEDGNGETFPYVDSGASPAQRDAIDRIASGRADGGIFAIFAQLTRTMHPIKVTRIDFHFDGPRSWFRVGGAGEAHSETITYPDGTEIFPTLDLPHGIEYKRGLNTNARRWSMREARPPAEYENKYAAIATVKFTDEGCVG